MRVQFVVSDRVGSKEQLKPDIFFELGIQYSISASNLGGEA